MITSKKQMLNVMKNCAGADTLTREEKFQVFVNVCCVYYQRFVLVDFVDELIHSKSQGALWPEIVDATAAVSLTPSVEIGMLSAHLGW